jgi:hypothetical protein
MAKLIPPADIQPLIEPILKYIKDGCNYHEDQLMDGNRIHWFFYRLNRWWMRVNEEVLYRHLQRMMTCEVERVSDTLAWLVANNYIVMDNFDSMMCNHKWYRLKE